MTTHSHHDNVEKQFGSQANAYLHSAVHASGRDLARLAQRLSDFFPRERTGYGMWSWTREFCRCATCLLGRGIRFIRQHA